jgi:hypothetical protein
MYYYDSYGWQTLIPNSERIVDSTPLLETNGMKNNWTGTAWTLATYSAPIVEPTIIDPKIWWIDVGPFKDRFGIDMFAIASSDNPICRAVKESLYDRKYVDLKDPKVAMMIDLLISGAQPSASSVFTSASPMTQAKKITILNTPTTEAERSVKNTFDR